jgi:hypothetical protein
MNLQTVRCIPALEPTQAIGGTMKQFQTSIKLLSISLLAGLSLLLASCGNAAPPAEKTYTLTVSNLCPISVMVSIDNVSRGIFAPAQARDFTLTQGSHSVKAVPAGGGTPFEQSITLIQNDVYTISCG